MKLYFSPATCALAAHITLEESGLAYDAEGVRLDSKETDSGVDYFQINPLGYVPLLVTDEGDTLSEVPAILHYVADMAPEKQLIPPIADKARYQMLSKIAFISTELHKGFGPLFSSEISEEWRTSTIKKLSSRLSYVNDYLADNTYFFGDRFSIADAYLFTVLNWSTFVNVSLESWPNLEAFQLRIAGRTAVRAALKAEGLID